MTDFSPIRNPNSSREEIPASTPFGTENSRDEFYSFPLSFAQECMWHADREKPGNPAYNGSFRWKLTGRLNSKLLERTFNEIVCRHEVLRATFPESGGKPIQIIAPSLALSIPVQDLRSLSSADREAEMDRLCSEEATRGFDLEKGPLIRVGLLRMEDESYVLMLTMHHIISDGWSIGLMMEELQQIYSAFAEGRPSPLPELTIQYPDYVVWQRRHAEEPEIARQLAFWEKKLSGYKPLEVATDFPRPLERTYNSSIVSSLLPQKLTDALKEFSNQQGGTMFITTLAACMVLLRSYTGETDISVGSPLAGRNRTDTENLVGLFINPVVFRTQITDDPRFPEFMARVRETVWEALANQDVPFEKVLQAMRHAQDPNREPFFLINFISQREYARASTFVFEFAGIHMSTLPSKSQGALYDLNFFLVERKAGWRLSLEYNTDLYREATAHKLLTHFRKMLEEIATNPHRKLSEFSLPNNATPARGGTSERAEIYAMPASVAQNRFWLLAKLAPANPAFHMPACVRLSGPLSALMLGKSFQFLMERHESLRTTFEEIRGELAQIIAPAKNFSLPISSLENFSGTDQETRLQELLREEARQPFDLEHGPLLRARLFRLGANDHVLIITLHHILADGWSQNIFQRELWSNYETFMRNKEPELAPLAIQYSDFAAWQKEWLSSEEAREHLNFWMKQLSGTLPVLDFPVDQPLTNRPALRGALETRLLPDDLTLSLKKMGQAENATMFSLMLACFGVLLSRYTDQDDILVGSPVSNRRTETEPLLGPFAGPIALRLNLSGNPTLREALQRTRDVTFDALGHTELPFEVLLDKLKIRSVHGRNPLFQFYFFYQTAFLQPRRADGLEVTPMPTFSVGTPFEMQVGIIERAEGTRIQLEYNPDLFETSTVQEVLRYYEMVLRTLVSNQDQTVRNLAAPPRHRDTAKPEQMIPSTSSHGHDAPHDPMETTLANIWQEIFEEPVGVRDNFFDIGGHSILAARLLTRIEQVLGRELSFASLLDAPTIEQQARLIRGETKLTSQNTPASGKGSSTEIPFFYLGGDPTFQLLSQRLSAIHDFHNLGMQASFVRDMKEPHSLSHIAKHFVRAIRERRPEGPYMLGGWCDHGLLALETARQLQEQGQEVALLILLETGRPGHRKAGPPWKRAVSRMHLKLHLLKFEYTYLRQISPGQAQNYILGRIKRRILRMKNSLGTFVGGSTSTNGNFPVGSLDALYGAAEHYQPQPYNGPVVLIRSQDRVFGFAQDLRLGWGNMLGKDLEIHEVRGNHYTFYMEPNVGLLALEITTCVRKVEKKIARDGSFNS